MKILVIGASQGTGALCCKLALEKGHSVTAFARTPAKLELTHPQLTKLTGDFHDQASVNAAVKGHDAVIITASTTIAGYKKRPDFFSSGTRFVIDAMKQHGAKRLIVLSAYGAGDSFAHAPWFMRTLVVSWLLKLPYADHNVQEQLTHESGLEWVIARPTRLTDGPAKGKFKPTTGYDVPMVISRADVARFLVDSCDSNEFLNKNVQLGG